MGLCPPMGLHSRTSHALWLRALASIVRVKNVRKNVFQIFLSKKNNNLFKKWPNFQERFESLWKWSYSSWFLFWSIMDFYDFTPSYVTASADFSYIYIYTYLIRRRNLSGALLPHSVMKLSNFFSSILLFCVDWEVASTVLVYFDKFE